MAHEETFAFRARRAIVRLITFSIVVALSVVAALLLSKLNARTYRVEMAEGQLRIMKGKHQPLGFEPYRPSDPLLADAYAPIQLSGEPKTDIVNRTFHEREELDRALFSLFEATGRPKLFSDDPKEVQEGLYFLRRAEKLTGITEEQRRTLKNMQSDIAYHQGREKLDDARKLIAEALTDLQVAANVVNRNTRSAHQMMLEVGPPAKALEEALRRAVYQLSNDNKPAVNKPPPPPVPPAPLDIPEPKPPPNVDPAPNADGGIFRTPYPQPTNDPRP